MSDSSPPPPVALPVIPRYRLERPAVLFHDDGSMAVRPVEDPTGAWVRAEDADKALIDADANTEAERFRSRALQDSIDGCAQRVKELADRLKVSEAARLLAEQQREALQAQLIEIAEDMRRHVADVASGPSEVNDIICSVNVTDWADRLQALRPLGKG